MIDRCEYCPLPPEDRCNFLRPTCERMPDPEFRERALAHLAGRQVARALDLPDPEPDPQPPAAPPLIPIPLGGCCH